MVEEKEEEEEEEMPEGEDKQSELRWSE